MGYKHVTIDEYQEELWALPESKRDLVNGWSPGYVAARLGITRQAVHNAITRGRLNAYRISESGSPGSPLRSIIIPEESVRAYENSEQRAKLREHQLRAQAS